MIIKETRYGKYEYDIEAANRFEVMKFHRQIKAAAYLTEQGYKNAMWRPH